MSCGNIGGTATLIGDPPNIMLGSAVKELTFMAFIINLAPIAAVILAVHIPSFILLFRKQIRTTPELQQSVIGEQPDGSLHANHGALIGASANLIATGMSGKEGHPITFLQYMKYGFPLMLLSIMMSSLYLYLRYLL